MTDQGKARAPRHRATSPADREQMGDSLDDSTSSGPRLGHVHLRVSDLEESVAFYRRHLGLSIVERVGRYVFLSGGAAHHDLALQETDRGGTDPGAGVGLFHSAWEAPDEATLVAAAAGLEDDGVPYRSVDHGISWALYFSDPDGLGVEIFLDRRGEADGRFRWEGLARPLDLTTGSL